MQAPSAAEQPAGRTALARGWRAGRNWLAAHPRRCALLLGALTACAFQPLAWWPAALIGVAGLLALVAGAKQWRGALLLGWLWGLGHFSVGNNWIATAFSFQAKMPSWLGWAAVVLLAAYLAVFPAFATGLAWMIANSSPERGGGPAQLVEGHAERGAELDGSAPSPVPLHHPAGTGALARPASPDGLPPAVHLARLRPPPRSGEELGRHAALILALAGSWAVGEWLRSWVCTGFAWNPLAVAALGSFAHPGLAAVLPWLGTYALSGVVVILAGCWWAALTRSKFDAAAVGLLAAPVVLLLQPGQFGARDRSGTLAYTVVQPDISQPTLDDPQFFQDHFLTEAALSYSGAAALRRVVLWPESGVPDYLQGGYPPDYYRATTFAGDPALARARLGRAVGPASVLLTGAVDVEFRGGQVADARNVVTALDEHGTILGSYAKAHLVPYGEYLPERALLGPLGLARLVPGDIDFRPGSGPQTLDLGSWGRAGIQICYEIIFSGQVVDRTHRPDYIVNPSNDGWFGSWGPPQHLAQARLRAIEEGLPVLRPTVSGVSAVIDADGIVHSSIARGRAARLDGMIPSAHPPTLFARWGNALALGWAAIWLITSVVATRRQAR